LQREFLPREADCPDFINADLIAQSLSPFKPEAAAVEAANIRLSAIRRKVARRQSFAFETTLAARSYASRIPEWRKLGYRVKLIFLSLPSSDMAVARVASRVAQAAMTCRNKLFADGSPWA
jgi:predicted ABC-type ATPase